MGTTQIESMALSRIESPREIQLDANGGADQHAPIAISFGSNIEVQDAGQIIGYATQAIHNIHEMRRNAMSMCIALAKCRASFAISSAESGGGSEGWEKFATANFLPHGLSLRNVRSAIAAGKMLIEKQLSDPDVFKTFHNLSRAALFTLSESPGVIDQVVTLISTSSDSRVTAAEIRELQESARRTESDLSATRQELLVALKKAESAQSSNLTLNAQLLDREQSIESLKDSNDELARAARTPIESLVPTLPDGVKTEAELKSKLDEEIHQGQEILNGVRTQTEKANEKLTAVQRLLQEQVQSADVISNLRTDIANLTARYSLVLVKRVTESSTMTKSALAEISLGLHALADQLSPTI